MNIKLKDFLKTKKQWTKGSMAKDILGNNVNYKSPLATQWCLFGVIYFLFPPSQRNKVIKIIRKTILKYYFYYFNTEKNNNLIKKLRDTFIFSTFNDHSKTTFEDVKKLLKLADI